MPPAAQIVFGFQLFRGLQTATDRSRRATRPSESASRCSAARRRGGGRPSNGFHRRLSSRPRDLDVLGSDSSWRDSPGKRRSECRQESRGGQTPLPFHGRNGHAPAIKGKTPQELPPRLWPFRLGDSVRPTLLARPEPRRENHPALPGGRADRRIAHPDRSSFHLIQPRGDTR